MKNRIKNFFPSLTFSSPFLTFLFPFSSPFLTSLFPLLLTFLTLFAGSVASAQIPSSGLVGYWPFNGNANDESGNGNNGTVNGPTLTSDRFGNANSAYSFNGNTIDINSGSQFEITQTSQLTVNFWYYTTSTASPVHFLGKRSTTVGNLNWQFAYNIGSGEGIVFNGALGGCSTGSQITTGQWEMLTGVYSNGNWTVYRNGSYVTTATANVQNDLGNILKIGNSGSAQPFYGKLDDISIYNRVLTPTEITQLFTDQTSTVQAPCPTLATNLQTGLVGYWPFCGNANDESGNGNNGTVNGATLTTDRFGNANSAYNFNSNSYIRVPFSSSINSIQNGFTMSAWVLMDGGTVAPRVLELRGAYGGGGDAGFGMLSHNNSNSSRPMEVRWYNNYGNTNISVYPSQEVSALSWHHLLFTCNGPLGVGDFYVDGVLVNTNNVIGDQGPINSCNYNFNDLFIGAEPNLATFWGGLIDDVAIYNRALSPAEVTQLYTDPSVELALCPTLATNIQTGLVGYWPFCGNANDESGNGHNLNLTGACTLIPDRNGNVHSAMSLDGNNSYLSTSNSFFNASQDHTISIWLNLSSLNSAGATVSDRALFNTFPYPNHAIELWGINASQTQAPNNAAGYLGNGTVWQSAPTFSYQMNIDLNVWHHWIMTKNGNLYLVYLDGILVSQFTNPNLAANIPVGVMFGSMCGGPLWPDWEFNGFLDDISIYNRALTPTEITQLYTDPTVAPIAECTPFLGEDQTVCAGTSVTLSASGSSLACPTLPSTLQNGLVGYWPFCGNANDASGNGNNGTLTGGNLANDRFGNSNSALQFTGATQIMCTNYLATNPA
jgi:hypothetical protein